MSSVASVDSGYSARATSAEQDVLLSCMNDFCVSLHVQAGVMSRCVGLHRPSMNFDFMSTLESIVSDLTVAIERSRGDLVTAAHMTGGPTASKEANILRVWDMVTSRPTVQADGRKQLTPSRQWCHGLSKCNGLPMCDSPNTRDGIYVQDDSSAPEELRLNFKAEPVFFPMASKPRAEVPAEDEEGGESNNAEDDREVGEYGEAGEGELGNNHREVSFHTTSKDSIEGSFINAPGDGEEGDSHGSMIVNGYGPNSPTANYEQGKLVRPTHCRCGNIYMADAEFCRACGRKRPEEDLAVMRQESRRSSGRKQSLGKRLSDAARTTISKGRKNSKQTPELTTQGTVSSLTPSTVTARRMSLCEQFDANDAHVFEEPMGKCIDGTMNPNWPGRLAWDLAVILLVVVDAMVLPCQMAYKHNASPDDFDNTWLWLTTIFFASDMFASFLTAYAAGNKEPGVEPGKMVTRKCRIARNYLRSWFVVDFASTIPWGKFADLLSTSSSSTRSAQITKLTKVVKFVRFLRLMRMLRLAKLVTIWERVEANLGSFILKQCVAMLKVLSVLVGICHWNACIWFMIGSPDSLISDMMTETAKKNWERMPHWTTVKDTKNNIWSKAAPLQQYIFCFYWTLGVMRTMPSEVTPTNNAERMYIMIFMFFAFSAFAICVALITQTFFKFSERNRIFSEDMAALREYMRTIHAPASVQAPVKAFLQHLFERRKIQAKEINIMQNLPNNLVALLKQAKLDTAISKLDVLEELPDKAKFYISELAEIKDMARGTCLCRRERMIDAAYILMYGRLDDKDNPEDGPLEVLHAECLKTAKIMVSRRTVISVSCSEVVKIDRAKFFNLLKTHDDFKQSMSFCVDLEDGAVDMPLKLENVELVPTQHTDTIAATAAIVAS